MSTPPADEPTERRDPLISITGQTGDVNIGDVAGRDIHKPTIAPGGIYAPYGTVHQPFIPQPVDATPDELAAAATRLAALPTDIVPPAQDTLPPSSWMSQLKRNQQFVGREADLLALARALKGGQSVAVNQAALAVASGLGGIGKTQLAIEFAYRYAAHFAGVFWLNFAQAGAIEAEIAACGGAGRLQLFIEAANLKLDEQVNLVKARWACGLPYLLIFDNCEEPALVRQHHPGGTTRVLITSRTPDWPGDLGVHKHALGVLQRTESIELLRQHRPALTDAEADELAAELGDLPLALHLAGRFLAGPAKNLAIKRYLDELRSPRIFERLPLLKQDGKLPTGHNRDVARTFALSFERLDPANSEDVLALKLLARMAYLVPGEVVPAALLQATLALPADDLDAELAAEAALDRLVALGLVEREADAGLRMHRLVGVYVRQVSGDAEAQGAVEQAVIREAGNLADAPTLAPIATFLPLLRGVTDAALLREDEDAATLCIWLGRHMDRLGSYTQAQPYVERALALRERVLGAEHPDTATSLNNLAGLLESQGDYAAARPLYERALALRERVLGADHPDTASSLNNLASLYQSQGDYAAARPLYQRALAIHELILGTDHPQTATSLNNLAGLLKSQGDYAAARPLFKHALAICERVLGADHPDTAQSLSNLAAILQDLGDYVAARPLLERALTIRERVLGADHPDTAQSLSNLALLHYVCGDYATSRPLFERALIIRERVLGIDHPDTAQSLNNLAGLLDSQGDYAAARSLYERALVIQERVLGIDHPDTATNLNNLASLLQSQGDYAAAHSLLERALAIREQVLGADHPDTATSLNNLAINQYYQGELAIAEHLMHRALEICEARLGNTHPTTQTFQQGLVVIQQRLAEALAPLLTAIADIAAGDDAQREATTGALTQLEAQGWMLRAPVERIWAGERDAAALTQGLDEQDTALIERILALIAADEHP
jgi:tetratricopeptide (TPR) repeat protein